MPVLDASAVLNAFPFSFQPGKKYFTVPGVIKELKDFRSKAVVEAGLQAEQLVVTSPSEDSIKKVRKKAEDFGLSEADVMVLALAWEKNEEIWTDDYGIQKVAKLLGVDYRRVIHPGAHPGA